MSVSSSEFRPEHDRADSDGSQDYERTVREAVERIKSFVDKMDHGIPSESEEGDVLDDLLITEAEYLRPFLPGILEPLGYAMVRLSADEQELEKIDAKRDPSDEELRRMMEILDKPSGEDVPRCEIALLVGHLGRGAPDEAAGLLLDAVPLPDRVEDDCVARALMILGPSAYPFLARRLLVEKSKLKLYVGTLALVAAAQNTDFLETAGLGSDGEVNTFPESRRGLRHLVRKWEKWWSEAGEKYTWNPDTALLEVNREE